MAKHLETGRQGEELAAQWLLAQGFAILHRNWKHSYFELDVMSTIFIGLCVAITALPVSIRILMDLGKLNSPVGQKIISVAIFDDVIALTVLGILLDLKDVEPTFANISQATVFTVLKLVAFLFIIALTYKLIQRLAQKENFIENQLNTILTFLKGKESLFAVFFVFILISLNLFFIPISIYLFNAYRNYWWCWLYRQ